ncbi:hypothetical protein HYE82_22480 [Streptomyces sp. BR123]|uniref:DUF7224 domain-containing protein n=1 Tax=Streptomyces sp. BR123 TaxID=2749828 RepID=UPI0015C46633|nr:hypothetical protein [Streptomyces sp. BR123]NXY97096.1 hypothetical protein [Streptomyces sp. BR123]
MRLRTLLRTSSATALLPFLLLHVVVLLGDAMASSVLPGHGPSVVGPVELALAPAAAACAAAGAWEAARLRRGRVPDQAPVRSPLTLALTVLLPVWGMGLAGLAAALIVTSRAAGALPAPSHTGMLAAYAAVLAAASLLGHLLGRVLPGLAAAPVAMVVGFCLVGFPVSFETPWPRHLVARAYESCCHPGQVIDPAAVWAPLLLATGLCLAAALVIHPFLKAARLLAVALAAAAAAVAVWLVHGLDHNPVLARDPSDLVCDTRGRPTVCLWPETPDRGRAVDLVRSHTARLTAAGVPVADTLSAAPRPGASEFGGKGIVSDADIPLRLASTLMPPVPACARTTGQYPATQDRQTLHAWLTATATGTPPVPVPHRYTAQDIDLVRQVLAQPPAVQLAWYEQYRKALAGCTDRPDRTVPGGAR